MDQQAHETHIDADNARAGETPHIVRWVLGVSLALAVVAMSVVWIIPAMSGESTIDDEVPAQAGD